MSRIAELREAAKNAARAAEQGERRVYIIPTATMERVLIYQASRAMRTEAQAVRTLLDDALTAWESAQQMVKPEAKP